MNENRLYARVISSFDLHCIGGWNEVRWRWNAVAQGCCHLMNERWMDGLEVSVWVCECVRVVTRATALKCSLIHFHITKCTGGHVLIGDSHVVNTSAHSHRIYRFNGLMAIFFFLFRTRPNGSYHILYNTHLMSIYSGLTATMNILSVAMCFVWVCV